MIFMTVCSGRGEEYILEELAIYKIADAEMMRECFPGFHTLDVEMAVDNLKEIYRQRCSMDSF